MTFALSNDHLLLTHAGCTLFMTGLIWVIQVVHYPLFAYVGADDYERYHQLHMQRITWIVMPVMLAELLCAIVLAMSPLAQGQYLSWVALGLLLLIWLSTALFQVPAHTELASGWNDSVHARLVQSNWIRTLLWSARSIIALWLLRL
jgi:hypothetical protein